MPSEWHGRLAGSRVVVTGATGFVGSRLVRELIAAGVAVTALTRRLMGPPSRLSECAERIDWRECDLTDAAAAAAIVQEVQPRFVFHLAAAIDMRPDADMDVLRAANVDSALAVVGACRDISGLELCVHTGSCAEYGDVREYTTEESPLAPNTPYGASKVEASLRCRELADELDVPLCILRPYNLYGEHEAPTRLIPHVAMKLLVGERVDLTAGEQTKDYLYVGDLARAYLAAASAPLAARSEFNIGFGESFPLREFVERFADAMGADRCLLRFGAVPYRENEMWHQGTSIDKAREILGWGPSLGLDEGLAVTARWYESHRGLYE